MSLPPTVRCVLDKHQDTVLTTHSYISTLDCIRHQKPTNHLSAWILVILVNDTIFVSPQFPQFQVPLPLPLQFYILRSKMLSVTPYTVTLSLLRRSEALNRAGNISVVRRLQSIHCPKYRVTNSVQSLTPSQYTWCHHQPCTQYFHHANLIYNFLPAL